jgi:hypothetical protein
MDRLDGCDDIQFSQAGEVFPGEDLDVFDSVRVVGQAVDLLKLSQLRIGIENNAVRFVTDGMDRQGQASLARLLPNVNNFFFREQ